MCYYVNKIIYLYYILMYSKILNHVSIVLGYTTAWHMLYYCTPVTNKFNHLIYFLHGDLIKKK